MLSPEVLAKLQRFGFRLKGLGSGNGSRYTVVGLDIHMADGRDIPKRSEMGSASARAPPVNSSGGPGPSAACAAVFFAHCHCSTWINAKERVGARRRRGGEGDTWRCARELMRACH